MPFLSSKMGFAQDAPVSGKIWVEDRSCIRDYIACIPDLIKRKGLDENRREILSRASFVKKSLYTLSSLPTVGHLPLMPQIAFSLW